MRFPNELKAVKNRNGISIRVNRMWRESYIEGIGKVTSQYLGSLAQLDNDKHISETALDKAEFDYIINNDGTIEDLIQKVKKILIKEKII